MHAKCIHANITIRDVPTSVHEALSSRAADAGQSLQSYLLKELETIVSMPTMSQLIAQVEASELGSFGASFAVEALREERQR